MAETRKDRVMSAVASLALAALLAVPAWWLVRGMTGTNQNSPVSAVQDPRAGRATFWMGLGTLLFGGGSVFFAGVGVWTLMTVGKKPESEDDNG